MTECRCTCACRPQASPSPSPVAVPVLPTGWTLADRCRALALRLGIGRMRAALPPGLYAVGSPDGQAPVLVTANYWLSVFHLRRALAGRSLWILVLDTAGINVWCAAGKGSFGTEELLRRIEAVHLTTVVDHRRLILPQLGAVGVAAPEVAQRSPWRVHWGPIRATDLPAFLDAGGQATPAMRQVRFALWDRLVLTPVELRQQFRRAVTAGLLLSVLAWIAGAGQRWPWALALPMAAWLGGCLVGPVLLPWLPGRPFLLKGAILGAGLGAGLAVLMALGWTASLAVLYLCTGLTAFFLLQFTGCTTFTGISGVERELRRGLAPVALLLVTGLALWSVSAWRS